MKILDARWEGPHGIGRFAKELRPMLNDFVPAAVDGRPSNPLDPFVLYRYLKSKKPALFFSPGYNPPIGRPCPFAFCVHDLNHLCVRENSSAAKRAYYEYLIRPAILRAGALITGSEFSRSQISEWSGVDPSRITAVGYGVSEAFVLEGRKHDEAGRPYFLCVGNHKAHKNLERTIEAFAAGFRNKDFLLLLTGTASAQIESKLLALAISKQVKFVGSVSDPELACLYRGAIALVFVSLYEGFGLPIIESMACGGPVVTSTTTATPEVAGNAAILVDPTDEEAITNAMQRLADNQALRDSLRQRGLERSSQFRWDITCKKVREVLSTCV